MFREPMRNLARLRRSPRGVSPLEFNKKNCLPRRRIGENTDGICNGDVLSADIGDRISAMRLGGAFDGGAIAFATVIGPRGKLTKKLTL